MLLGTHPHLAKMERVPEDPAKPLNRMKDLPPTFTGIWWYSDYPDHYAGDARFATEEKGRALVRLASDCLAKYIAAVKADEVVPALNAEFFRRTGQVGKD
jgi:creatinine amidohydrolase